MAKIPTQERGGEFNQDSDGDTMSTVQFKSYKNLTLGSHEEVRKDFRPLYLAKRFLAGTSNGVSTSSGYSEILNSSINISNTSGTMYIMDIESYTAYIEASIIL